MATENWKLNQKFFSLGLIPLLRRFQILRNSDTSSIQKSFLLLDICQDYSDTIVGCFLFFIKLRVIS